MKRESRGTWLGRVFLSLVEACLVWLGQRRHRHDLVPLARDRALKLQDWIHYRIFDDMQPTEVFQERSPDAARRSSLAAAFQISDLRFRSPCSTQAHQVPLLSFTTHPPTHPVFRHCGPWRRGAGPLRRPPARWFISGGLTPLSLMNHFTTNTYHSLSLG